ncbi:MAG: glycosyltransferase [Cellulophaga fucicola]
MILFLGGLDTSGGMFNYLKAWIDEHKNNNTIIGVCAIPEVLDKIHGVESKIPLPYKKDDKLKRIYFSLLNKNYKSALIDIEKEVEKFQPNYIHFVDETIFYPFFSNIAKDICKVITVHDPIYHPGQFNKITTRFLCLISRWSYFLNSNLYIHLHSSKLIFPSILFFFSRKVIKNHPLPSVLFKSKSTFSCKPKVAFMGRIEKYKGINLFIDSINSYEINYQIPIEIIIAGNGDFDKNILKKVSSSITVENRFLEDIEFHKIMSDIDILILPYISATQSGVGYLAKAYNRKIICTNVGNLPDLIGDETQGYVVEPNKDNIAKAINEIVKNN